jgi:hypothetical protein
LNFLQSHRAKFLKKSSAWAVQAGDYFLFAVPFPGNGMCCLSVVLGLLAAVPFGTKRPETELRSPILLCGFLPSSGIVL